MLKNKYLHRRKGDKNDSKKCTGEKFKRKKYIDSFSELPKHESMRQFRYNCSYCSTKPLFEFLMSKVGQDWNVIYSEILTKIKHNYRNDISYSINRITNEVIYDDEYIPRDKRGRIYSERLFVDMNNILTYKTKEELFLDSKKIIRSQKLKEIIENSEKENENQSSD